MDLELVAHQMRLDAYALRVSRCLAAAAVPHVLLKGPTTARWLYSPPRLYRDVDFLVSPSRLQQAVHALQAAGLARAAAGRPGEEASHSLLMLSPEGIELDMHFRLPLMPPMDARMESLLWAHSEPFELDGEEVAALDLPARCVLLVLHAVSSGENTQAAEDLRRCRAAVAAGAWQGVQELASALGVEDIVRIATSGSSTTAREYPLEVRLLRRGAAGAYQLQRLGAASRREVPRLVLREIFPSTNFMRRSYREPDATGFRLMRLYAQRIIVLTSHLPEEFKVLRSERRSSARPSRPVQGVHDD